MKESKALIASNSTHIILVDPSLPENIGAVARAMKNMGFRNLRLVLAPGREPHLSDAARRMSAGSEDILERAAVYPSVREALSDLHIVVGSTARQGKGRKSCLEPKGLPAYLSAYAPDTKLGIVFGREDRGLTNDELDLSNVVLTIPTSREHKSLNLAQAVLLVCYELAQRGPLGIGKGTSRAAHATSEELEQLFQHARKVLVRVGFLDPQNPDRILRVLRRLLGRARPDSREVAILRGILRQMDWYAGRTEPKEEKDSNRS